MIDDDVEFLRHLAQNPGALAEGPDPIDRLLRIAEALGAHRTLVREVAGLQDKIDRNPEAHYLARCKCGELVTIEHDMPEEPVYGIIGHRRAWWHGCTNPNHRHTALFFGGFIDDDDQAEDKDGIVNTALAELIDNVTSGLFRPGSWERPWLEQALGEDRIDQLLDHWWKEDPDA